MQVGNWQRTRKGIAKSVKENTTEYLQEKHTRQRHASNIQQQEIYYTKQQDNIDSFHYSSQHNIIICTLCSEVVSFSHLGRHVRQAAHQVVGHHTKDWRDKLTAGFHDIPELNTSEVTISLQPVEPILGLPIFTDGLQCTFEGQHCAFIGRHLTKVYAHLRHTHVWINPRRTGRPRKVLIPPLKIIYQRDRGGACIVSNLRQMARTQGCSKCETNQDEQVVSLQRLKFSRETPVHERRLSLALQADLTSYGTKSPSSLLVLV